MMRTLGLTAAFVALILLTVGCNPGSQPPDSAPPSQPAVQTDAPAASSPTIQPESTPAQPDADQADATDSKQDASDSTSVRVLGAIGKAVRNSVTGEGQK
jgi:hypothetical protein